MDELPDLQTDADVDALMGRLRARVAPPVAAMPIVRKEAGEAPPPPATGGLAELLSAQETLTGVMMRAMTAIAEALDELHAGDGGAPVSAAPARRRQLTGTAVPARKRSARGRRR
jgi:hypothetical protein